MGTIKIAGAGPSGLSASIFLAKAGYNVELYERNKEVGSRFVNSFQAFENTSGEEDFLVTLKKIGIDINFFCSPQTKLTVYDDNSNGTELTSKEPFWYLIKRGTGEDTLDTGLKKQALEAGVKLLLDKEINLNDADIIATGGKAVDGIAKEMVFDTDLEEAYDVILDNNVAPKGYSYLLVNNKKATIAVAIVENFNKIDYYFQTTLDKLKKIHNFDIKNEKQKVNYVSFFLAKSPVKNGKLLIGEAAGFQDFTFGFGLRYAITSAYLASQSIIHKKDYSELCRKEFKDRLEAGIVNRFLYELGGNSGFKMFIKEAKKSNNFKNYLRQWYNATWPKKALLPVIKFLIRHSEKCLHGDNCSWCWPKRR